VADAFAASRPSGGGQHEPRAFRLDLLVTVAIGIAGSFALVRRGISGVLPDGLAASDRLAR